MATKIILKTGNETGFNNVTLDKGEPAFVADKGKFYLGDGTGKVLINPDPYVHPTGDGNSHVPATGTSSNGKYLKAGSTAGSFSWADFASDVRATVLTGLSTATNAAISAADSLLGALGKLQAQIESKCPTSHASTGTTYGVGTTSNYGHVKVTNSNGLSISSGTISMSAASISVVGTVKLNNTTSSTSTTEAATANAVKAAYDLAASKADSFDVIDGGGW